MQTATVIDEMTKYTVAVFAVSMQT